LAAVFLNRNLCPLVWVGGRHASVNRSFYIDQPNGQNYFSFLIKELPQYLKDVFGLAPKRENTLIAGISMGGYGCFKAALLHPEMYCAAASFSGALSLEMWRANPTDPRIPEFTLLFGDINKLAGSEHDPAVWLKRGAQNPKALPKLYISCGRQDDLYPLSIGFYKACQALGVHPSITRKTPTTTGCSGTGKSSAGWR